MNVNSGGKIGTLSPPDTGGSASGIGARVTPGLVIVLATVVALAIRLFTLSRPGFLTSPTEYDDGVYLGAAIRLTQGVLPYHDFAFVQPPGILLLMSPVALIARATSTAAGLAVARVLTVLASTACIPLAGNLVRYRGTIATALTCGILAIYPADIASAHTLLLEPWMNLLCLLGANAAFSRGRLAPRTSRLVWAGIAIGFASVVKFWAMAPAAILLAVVLLDRSGGTADLRARLRRAGPYVAGLAGAFLIPLAPFFFSGPAVFFHSTVTYQAARVGTYTPLSLRLAHITGLIDVMNYFGSIALAGGNSDFAQAVVADTAPSHPDVLPFIAFLVLAALIVMAFAIARRTTTQAEWFALGTTVVALGAILIYSAFFYHYPAFPGPWLAIVTGIALSTIVARVPGLSLRRAAVGAVGVVLVAAATIQLIEVAEVQLPTGMEQIADAIPAGACVLTDETSLVISADRFEAAKPGCPVVIDSLATTLVFAHGVSIQGGADNNRAAVARWRAIFSKVQYVWLSPNHTRRFPWPGYEIAWFNAHFTQIQPSPAGGGPNVECQWGSCWFRGYGQLFVRKRT